MKKFFLYILLILGCYNFSNSAKAAENTFGFSIEHTKHSGKGKLYLTEKIIDEYWHYIKQPPSAKKLPLVFFISEDKMEEATLAQKL